MKKTLRSLCTAMLLVSALTGAAPASAQTTVLTEDFSGATNIFGITQTEMAVGAAAVHDTGLAGFGKVLAVCKTTAEGAISGTDGQPVAATDGTTVTAEWDALHGYFGNSRSTTVSLINSDGDVLASYVYTSSSCKVTSVTIGGQAAAGFTEFSLQSRANASQGANGFGGNGRPYSATAGYNPHVAVTLTARGALSIDFTLQGNTTTLLGTAGSMKKDIAKLRIASTVDNTDRSYAIDNIVVTTDVMQQDPDYIEPIVGATIVGAASMTFGPTPDTAYENPYSVVLSGSDGTLISEETISDRVTDFSVTWDIDGFRTENDTEGQYCDSYGSFSVNSQGRVATTFDLRDVPMNFFGKMTATIRYNGTTTVAEKYVMAQGDLTRPATQVLPLAGYPSAFSTYPDALTGYVCVKETYGSSSDPILGGWCVAGSDGDGKAQLLADADGTKYVHFSAGNLKKSHVMTKTIDAPTSQVIFAERMRFVSSGAVVTLTSGYPFWSSSRYTCPVQLSFNGGSITLNGTALTNDGADATFATGTWYDIVLSADKSSESCYALVFDTEGRLLGQSGVLPWAETSNPTYFSIGMGNSVTGSVDVAAVEAFVPTVDTDSYALTADKPTLSIPQGESARLTATISDVHGYAITQQATWSVVEDDMRQSIVITPDEADSHQATVTLSPTAEAGIVTVQVNIGGHAKTLPLSLTTSDESIRFTKSTASITIPMDEAETATATFAAIVIDGEGSDTGRPVALEAYEKDGVTPFAVREGIDFNPATGTLTVAAQASPATLTIRATGTNSNGEALAKSVSVNIHGMKFDFGFADDDAVAEGFTVVGPATAYQDANGYGIVTGTVTAGGTASATDPQADYLEGAMQFDFKAQKGSFYTVEITYRGVLTTGYVNSDLAGYELGQHETLSTESYTIPATLDIVDLHVAPNDATTVAQVAQVTVTKQAKRQKRGKRVVHHIGDSTSANNGSWAYRLKNLVATTYPELYALCDFQNNGAGGRNLSTYYTQGKLASVLRDIYPDDVLMFGNNGTNGMGSSFEADVNYYLDAAEALGAKIIINSYTPHGAVANHTGVYDAETHTFDSYRRDSYETVVRRVALQREETDDNYLGFVEIGMNADAIFNAYVADYAANGYATADAAAQAIIQCFTDHNHYSNGTLACTLMLDGYKTTKVPGIVEQLIDLLGDSNTTGVQPMTVAGTADNAVYTLSGQRVTSVARPGLYIVNGRKVVVR